MDHRRHPAGGGGAGEGRAALNPRGERYSEATIRERLTMRDFMETLRASGVQTGGPDSLSQRDRQQFAAELEKWLLAVKLSPGLNPAIVIAAKIIVAKAGVEVVVPGIVGKELIVPWRNGSSPAVVSCAMLSCAEAASGCGFSSMILTISCGREPLNILVSILPSTTPPATPAAVCSAPAIKPPPRAADCAGHSSAAVVAYTAAERWPAGDHIARARIGSEPRDEPPPPNRPEGSRHCWALPPAVG